MGNKLKHFRVGEGATQTAIAEAVGVSQPTYQRWEAGLVDVPEAKLAKLAKVLKTTKEALLGRHPPIKAAFYDNAAPESLQYYGELAVHFLGGGESLLLSISEEARGNLFRRPGRASKFLILKDLGNRTVAIRNRAVSDLYLSSEAYDDYGPEHRHPGYKDGTPIQFPDPRDWEIIERLACGDTDLEDFLSEDSERIKSAILITDEQYKKLESDAVIKVEDLDDEKVKNAEFTDQIFEMATSIVYQLSTGQRRTVDVTHCELYKAFSDFVEEDGEHFDENSSIVLQSEGYHRAIFINPDAVDYISIPTHLLEQSKDNVFAAILDDGVEVKAIR